ncbi:DUF262 domain-containing protein [Desulfomicrobium escambiense]|uniref:DUF262 domain-containing protein n=1 Tax=Desulfomicrobium escambiense TaxID=29503 RepID=UPI0004164AC3|nr:DUF262 domain-containing protein [Desulfomicrobium escambiense]
MSLKTVEQIIHSVEKEDFLLPDFQRGYVWKSGQVEKYFKSLYKKYPTGSLIMWSAPKQYIKKEFNLNNESNLILDGQQRVTTLYLTLTGKRPHWILSNNEVPKLYFDLETEEFKIIKKYDKIKHRQMLCIREIYNNDVDTIIESSHDPDLFSLYPDKIIRLKEILNYKYYISIVDEPDVREVVDMFNSLNSEGTRLSETDLAMAIMVITWPSAKSEIARLVDKYKAIDFEFDKEFIVRCLNIIACEKAKYTELKNTSSSKLEQALKNLEKALDYISGIWRQIAFVANTSLFSSTHSFMLAAYYLVKNNNKFQTERQRNQCIFYTLVAMLWGRYSGATEATLEKDVRIIRERNSFDQIIKEIAQQRGNRIYPTLDDIKEKGLTTTISKIIKLSILANQPHDWFDPSLPLVSKVGLNTYSIETHHVFSRKLLSRIIPTNIGTSVATLSNQVGNIAYITSLTNKSISDAGPSLYLPEVSEEELNKQYIPTDKNLWSPDFESYSKFIVSRNKLIQDGVTKFLSSFYPDFAAETETDNSSTFLKIQNFEYKIRKIISKIYLKTDFTLKKFFSEQIYDKVILRINLLKKKNPSNDFDINNIEFLVKNLEMTDYLRIITSDHNWPFFSKVFMDPKTFRERFSKINDLRNRLAHHNDLDLILLKDGEVSFLWFDAIFDKFNNSKEILNIQITAKDNNFNNEILKTLLSSKYTDLKKELIALDDKISFPLQVNQLAFAFSPAQWGMSSKDIAPIIFSITLDNTNSEKQIVFAIEFTGVFKTQYRETFFNDLKTLPEFSDISFFEFEPSKSWKNNWIIKKTYSIDNFSEKIPQDYIELNTLIYDIGKIIRRYSTLKHFNSEISFF